MEPHGLHWLHIRRGIASTNQPRINRATYPMNAVVIGRDLRMGLFATVTIVDCKHSLIGALVLPCTSIL